MKNHEPDDADSSVISILAISGSLRGESSNTMLLRATAALAPTRVKISLYEGLANLPPFNPDLENANIATVLDLRSQLSQAQGILFSTPEYAHGIPGVLKNLLDWVVGSGELVDKPIALLNASPRSTYAQAVLLETLSVMSARHVSEASVTLSLLAKKMQVKDIISNPEMAASLRQTILTFQNAIEAMQ